MDAAKRGFARQTARECGEGGESIGELQTLINLIEQKKFVEARSILLELNAVYLAELLAEIENRTVFLLMFRLLPKETEAEVFAYLEHDLQQRVVEGITDRELAGIVD